jgi:hypothetical protein
MMITTICAVINMDSPSQPPWTQRSEDGGETAPRIPRISYNTPPEIVRIEKNLSCSLHWGQQDAYLQRHLLILQRGRALIIIKQTIWAIIDFMVKVPI